MRTRLILLAVAFTAGCSGSPAPEVVDLTDGKADDASNPTVGLHLDISSMVKRTSGQLDETGQATPATLITEHQVVFTYNFDKNDPDRNATFNQIFTSDGRIASLVGLNWTIQRKNKDPITLGAVYLLNGPKEIEGVDINDVDKLLDHKFELRAGIPLDKNGRWFVEPEISTLVGGGSQAQVTVSFHGF
jgi:hypothetical protein